MPACWTPSVSVLRDCGAVAELQDRRAAAEQTAGAAPATSWSDERALDVGTGAGALARPRTARSRGGGRRHRPELLEEARQACARERRDRRERRVLRFRSGPDGFDLVMTARTLHHVDRPELVIAEMTVCSVPPARCSSSISGAERPARRDRAQPLRARTRPDDDPHPGGRRPPRALRLERPRAPPPRRSTRSETSSATSISRAATVSSVRRLTRSLRRVPPPSTAGTCSRSPASRRRPRVRR